jgi:hypothetical protein
MDYAFPTKPKPARSYGVDDEKASLPSLETEHGKERYQKDNHYQKSSKPGRPIGHRSMMRREISRKSVSQETSVHSSIYPSFCLDQLFNFPKMRPIFLQNGDPSQTQP